MLAEAAIVPESRFELVARLGEGGMGVVYAARDRQLDAVVAVKTLRTLGPDAILRLKNEFRALQGLHHENLVGLGELFEHQGAWFFTMELVEGVDFLRWVRGTASTATTMTPTGLGQLDSSTLDVSDDVPGDGGDATGGEAPFVGVPEFDEVRLRASLAQVARALGAIHAAGKVHRDVKPSNVLVAADGRVVVLDFGLIATAHADEDERLVGTAEYMAPEQAAREAVGPAADWYAVGVMLYQALTGRVPFQGRVGDVLARKQVRDPPAPREWVPGVPADLDALAMRLISRDPAARASGRDVLAALGVGADEEPAARVPFVGRETELARLREAFERCVDPRAGRPVVAVVEGESGMGKTALVSAFLEALDGRARVLASRCYERESVPYKAVDGVVDALSRTLSALPTAEAVALLPRNALSLAQVFPVLQRVPVLGYAGATATAAEPREVRARAFGAFRDLLARLADRGPVVVSVDDFQWADRDSLELLDDVLSGYEGPNLLLLLTQRPVQGGVAVPEGWRPERVAVGALPAEDAAAMARAIRADGDPETVAAESGGHPLFIGELARRPRGDAAPVRLDDALRARVDALDPVSRRILDLAAVAAGPVTREVAAAALGVPLGELVRRASQLQADRLVRTGPTPGSIEAYHDRIRATASSALSPVVRGELHASLARVLEARGGEPEAIAAHWVGAGDVGKAARHALRAAEEASAALAFDRAARLYRWALELDPPSAGRSGVDAARAVYVGLGEALANAGRGAEAAEAFRAAAEGAPRLDALDLRRRSAQQFLAAGRIDDGLAIIRAVLGDLGLRWAASPARALLSLLIARTRLRLRGTAFTERSEASLDPVERLRIDATYSMSLTLGAVDTIRGADFQTRNVLLSLDAGEPYRVARALLIEASYAAFPGGTASRALGLLDLARPIAARVGHPHALAWGELSHAYVAFLCGRFDEAIARYDRAEPMFRDHCRDVAYETDSIELFRLWSLYYSGDLGRLSAALPAAIAESRDRGDLTGEINLRTRVAHVAALAEGDPERASTDAADAVRAWSREGFFAQHWYELYAQTQADLYRGDGAAAYARVSAAWPALSRSLLLEVQFIRLEALHLRARAAVAAALASPSAWTLRWARLDAWRIERAGMAWATPLAGLVRAAVAAQSGDRAAAVHLLSRAAAGADAAGLRLYAEAARRRWGEVEGGEAGRARVAEADAWLTSRGVRDPARFVAMLAPGFAS